MPHKQWRVTSTRRPPRGPCRAVSLITPSGRSPLPGHEDPHAAPWQVPRDREQRGDPPTATIHLPTSRVRHLGGGLSRPMSSLQRTADSSGRHVDCTLRRDREPEPSSQVTPQLLTLKTNTVSVCCCFKPLTVRVACYSDRELTEHAFPKARLQQKHRLCLQYRRRKADFLRHFPSFL